MGSLGKQQIQSELFIHAARMTSGHCPLCYCSLALVHSAVQAQRGDTIPWPWDTGAERVCAHVRVHARARTHTHTHTHTCPPQGGQVATPDGEPHGKETHRLADTFSSHARGEYMNFQLAQEGCVCVCGRVSTYGMGSES